MLARRRDRWRGAVRLVGSKVRNYARLAEVFDDKDLAERLDDNAWRVGFADGYRRLLGLEGKAARCWFDRLPEFLPDQFEELFQRRVAPDARDPVNALLNLGYSALYRWGHVAVLAAGINPYCGFFHRPRPGPPTMVSDLIEPFRYLADRAVIQSLEHLDRSDFEVDASSGDMVLRSRAVRQVVGLLAAHLSSGCRPEWGDHPARLVEARSYRHLVFDQAIRLADWIRGSYQERRIEPLETFYHPASGT